MTGTYLVIPFVGTNTSQLSIGGVNITTLLPNTFINLVPDGVMMTTIPLNINFTIT